jgi:hypothetical protein
MHGNSANLLRPDTPRSINVEAFGAEVISTEASAGTYVAALSGHRLDLAILLSLSDREWLRAILILIFILNFLFCI